MVRGGSQLPLASKHYLPLSIRLTRPPHPQMLPRHSFFWVFAWFAAHGRFSSVFLLSQGIHEDDIGYMFAIASLLSVPASSIFAYIGDAMVQRGHVFGRELVVAMLVLLTTLFFILQLLPSMIELTPASSLMLFYSIRILYGIFRAPITQILDSIAVQHVAVLGKESDISYGSERAWGAVSWAVVSIMVGVCIDLTSISVMYILTFVMAVPILISLALSSRDRLKLTRVTDTTPYQPVKREEDNENGMTDVDSSSRAEVLADAKESLVQKLPMLVSNYFNSIPKVSFLICIIILNAGMSIVENLLFIFFTQTLHASSVLCGLTVVVTVIFEIPFFQYSHVLQQHLGRSGLMTVAMIAYGTRVIGYTLVPNGWWVLLLEPLHGVTYSCAQLAAVDFASEFCPTGLEASSQTLIGTLRYGVGYVIGNAIAGYIEERFGADTLYRGAGMTVLLCLLGYRTALFLSSPPSQEPR